ncbi:acyltransferase family protein [Foetidibacter luteolus]|uniref:acyltransferase family protein n=1 Tax=Foetidibacter luteolus TaxID=2608880 RepID=UPI00129B0D19|nr:acyltransferase [Foetidibacter luteolus]
MQTSSRQAYLDWLRIMSIFGVLVFHSAMAFAHGEWWHIKNKETSNLLLEFIFWLSRFRMPLLFFISGTVSYFMLQKKSGAAFVGLRFRRLLLPLLFGMLLVVPPQIYLERVTQGFQGNFFDFYPRIFTGKPYPEGDLSWHHLWFIAYLFVYDVLFTPFFVFVMSHKGRQLLQRINWMARGKWVYLLTVPGILVYTFTTLLFPRTNDLIHDWGSLLYWLSFLLVGFVCIAHPLFMESLERNRRTSLGAAFITIIAINYVRWNGLEPWEVLQNYRSDWRTYGYLCLQVVTAWAWLLAAVGYGKKYLNKTHRSLNYINQAVYPFYILHQTVIVIVVYYVVQVNEGVGMKYAFTVLVSFALTLGIYHLFIRPYNLTRFMFGMKPKQPVKKQAANEAQPERDLLQTA